jgi:hypothetical protein
MALTAAGLAHRLDGGLAVSRERQVTARTEVVVLREESDDRTAVRQPVPSQQPSEATAHPRLGPPPDALPTRSRRQVIRAGAVQGLAGERVFREAARLL